VFVEEQVEVCPDNDTSLDSGRQIAPRRADRVSLITELGIWLSGLESFLTEHPGSLVESHGPTKEFRLVHSVLRRCALTGGMLLSSVCGQSSRNDLLAPGITYGELTDLMTTLRQGILLSEGLAQADSASAGEWRACADVLSASLNRSPAFAVLIRLAETAGTTYLPRPLKDLVENKEFLTAEHAELALVLPRFGRILLWLSIIGTMLERDQPLKPALLIFSRVNEQIVELTGYINSRLERFPNDDAEMFATLDAASYTASIELKKVYTQELSGVANIRPSPTVYARMETAHSLLNEGFQQVLAGLARLIEPESDIFELFPNFRTKLEQSIVLQTELRDLVDFVQRAEIAPEADNIAAMQMEIKQFMRGTVRFLFYKDTETVERFVEEILITRENKDLVPILHRFGAYLETLSSQVKLRAVLEQQPIVT